MWLQAARDRTSMAVCSTAKPKIEGFKQCNGRAGFNSVMVEHRNAVFFCEFENHRV